MSYVALATTPPVTAKGLSALVPAHNEESTVAGVVSTLVQSGCFDHVLVVDDGSTDRTAQQAYSAGAQVLQLRPNRGKGQAMLAGVNALPPGDIAFFDADLLGLTVGHVQRLTSVFQQGFDQVCGARDYGMSGNVWQGVAAIFGADISATITGERIVRRWVLEKLPSTCWSGYSIEAAINHVIREGNGTSALVLLSGLTYRTKADKSGRLAGFLGNLKMFREIHRTQAALRSSGGLTCKR